MVRIISYAVRQTVRNTYNSEYFFCKPKFLSTWSFGFFLLE